MERWKEEEGGVGGGGAAGKVGGSRNLRSRSPTPCPSSVCINVDSWVSKGGWHLAGMDREKVNGQL